MTAPVARATVDGTRIAVRTEGGVFEDMLRRCKAVRGGRWDSEQRQWTYPLSVDTCHELRAAFDAYLDVLPPLASWYRAQATQAAAHADLSRATDATLARLPDVAPVLAATLRPDQRVGVQWVANPYRGAGLVADHPGLGKTLELIGGILEADVQGPILVTCPRLSVRSVWGNLLHKWAPDERVYLCRGTRAKRQEAIDNFLADPTPRKWLVTVAETLRIKEDYPCRVPSTGRRVRPHKCNPVKHKAEQHVQDTAAKKTFAGYQYPDFFQNEWAAVVVDESHKMFGSLTVANGNLAGKGLKSLGDLAARRYAVTGTPYGKGGRVQGMFGTLMWLWPDEYTSFWRWVEQNFEVTEEEVFVRGGRGATKPVKRIGPLKGGKDEERFLHELGPRILRRTKKEVMPWLPDKVIVEVLCEMEDKQRRQYEDMALDGEIETDGGVLTANGVLAFITRAKQLASGVLIARPSGKPEFDPDNSCKLDNLIQRLEQNRVLEGDGPKTLISSQFNELLDAVAKRLAKEGAAHVRIDGSTTDKKRDDIVDAFQDPDGPRLLLLNSKAGGVSITLDAADEAHILDEMWDPGDNEQLEDRLHRASRALTEEQADDRPPVTIYYYRTEGTVDQTIAADVEGKRFEQFRVLDGRRGLAYLRELVRFQGGAEE